MPTNRWRLEITTNPEDQDEIWVGSVNGANGQKIYRSTDGGSSWANMSSSILDGDKVRDLAYHGGSGGLVYALTENSFYYYDPIGLDWIPYDSGLPTIQNVQKIKLFHKTNKIRMATYGRGVWESDMPMTYDPLALPMTTSSMSYCSRDTVLLESHSIVDQFNTIWQWTITPAPQYISDATARNPKVVFGNDGSYDVELMVTDQNSASDSRTLTDMITVQSNCDPDTIPGLYLQTYGSGDYVQLPSFESTTNSFTITAWIRPLGIQDNYASIVMNDGDAAGLNFREGNNTLGYHWPGGAWWWDSNFVAPSDEWSYVALVAEPSGITIYLNGVGVKHNDAINPVDLTTMKIGSYKGWSSRNYRGDIDEVCLWNRALSQTEIRELRHLTKDNISDPDFLAYYQFNTSGTQLLDKVNLHHGTVLGSSAFINSHIPIGGGSSHTLNVSSAGSYVAGSTGVALDFPGTGTLPHGDLVISQINLLPSPPINNSENLASYWVINNYGDKAFTDPVEMKFDDPNTSPSSGAINTPSSVQLLNRTDNNDALPWADICTMDSVDGENYVFNDASCAHPEMGQFFLVNCIANATLTMDYFNGDNIEVQVLDFINASNTLHNGSNIIYSAGNEINLLPDFEVKLGALFEAIMVGCQ